MMKYGAYDETRFRANVEQALQQVQSILDTTRHPQLVDTTVDHLYDDKFVLAETLTNTAAAVLRTALTHLGAHDDDKTSTWQQWLDWVKDDRTVTLRFEATDGCSLLKENVVEVEDPTATETTTTTTTKTTPTSSWMGGGGSSTTTTRVKRKLKEAHWRVNVTHALSAFAGTDADHAVVLTKREASTIIVMGGGNSNSSGAASTTTTNAMHPPIPEHTVHEAVDLDLTWFLRQLQSSSDGVVTARFAIDRDAAKTPRRNAEISTALEFFQETASWMHGVETFFTQRVEETILKQHRPVVAPDENNGTGGGASSSLDAGTICQLQNIAKEPRFNGKQVVIKEYIEAQQRYRVEPLHAADGLPNSLLVKAKDLARDPQAGNASTVQTLSVETLFVPVQPLLEDGAVLRDVDRLLAGHDTSLRDALARQSRVYPPRQVPKMLTLTEATWVLVCRHVQRVITQYRDGVEYLERLLYRQCEAAIGRRVTADDFTAFMRHHGRRLFAGDGGDGASSSSYGPQPFSYAVRRPGHSPDGVVSIECGGVSGSVPIDSIVRHVRPTGPLRIPLSAATTVPVTGDWYLHGWLMHQFGTASSGDRGAGPTHGFDLCARARQFSSFLLVIGTLTGATELEPKHAIILQNKDDLVIPLLTEVLPSAKDFKDAISSLSPEQQDFCKAFRSMQLQSSVFGVAIIQLKPQMEKLLGLVPGSLTKEIQLTQDLMSLFIEYQIPSDLLSFDGSEDTPKADRLSAVKEHVKAVLDVITAEKEKTITKEEQKAEYREAEAAAWGAMADEVFDDGKDVEVQPRLSARGKAKAEYKSKQPRRGGHEGTIMRSAKPMMAMAAPEGPTAWSAKPKMMAMTAPPPSAPPQAAAPAPSPLADPAPPSTSLAPHSSRSTASSAEDFTMLPKELDAKLETLDKDNALRSTVIKAGSSWALQRQDNLLTERKHHHYGTNEINNEKKKAFDLLDALSRSGSLPIEAAELHVIVALSHCFEKDLMGTVIEDNINPIAKAERSALLLASTVHRLPPSELLASADDAERLKTAFPLLFDK